MVLSQWIAFGAVMLVIAGLAYAFVRKGSRIKPDPDNKPPPDPWLSGNL
jgi:hypothetical protein